MSKKFMIRSRGAVIQILNVLLFLVMLGSLLSLSAVTAEKEGKSSSLLTEISYKDWVFDEEEVRRGIVSRGSFKVSRPPLELFSEGLRKRWESLFKGQFQEGWLLNYGQGRVKDKLLYNEDAEDIDELLDGKKELLRRQLLEVSADYLTDYLLYKSEEGLKSHNFIREFNWDYRHSLGARRWQAGVSALGAFRETKEDALVWQLRAFASEESSKGGNAGLIYRYIFEDKLLLGLNTFLDYERHGGYDEDFLRWSYGLEFKNEWLDVSANHYFPITDGILQNNNRYLYSREGYDVKLSITNRRWLSGGLTYYNWKGRYGDKDDKGFRYYLSFSPLSKGFVEGLNIELELDDGFGQDLEWGGRVSYHHLFNGPQIEGGKNFSSGGFDPRSYFFAPVRREYGQRINLSRIQSPDRVVLSAVLGMGVLSNSISEISVTSGGYVGVDEGKTVSSQGVYKFDGQLTSRISSFSGSTLSLSSSSWQLTVREESEVIFQELGSRLHVVTGAIDLLRYPGSELEVVEFGPVTAGLLGTRLVIGVGDAGQNLILDEGTISYTLSSDSNLTLLVRGGVALIFLPLLNEQITVGCLSSSQRHPGGSSPHSSHASTDCTEDVAYVLDVSSGVSGTLGFQGEVVTIVGGTSLEIATGNRLYTVSLYGFNPYENSYFESGGGARLSAVGGVVDVLAGTRLDFGVFSDLSTVSAAVIGNGVSLVGGLEIGCSSSQERSGRSGNFYLSADCSNVLTLSANVFNLTVVDPRDVGTLLLSLPALGGSEPYSYSLRSALPLDLGVSIDVLTGDVFDVDSILGRGGSEGTLEFSIRDRLGIEGRKTLALRIIDEVSLDGLSVVVALGQSTGVVATLSASGGLGDYSYSVIGALDSRLATLSVSGELLLSVSSALSSAGVLTITIETSDGFSSSRGVVELTVLDTFVLGDLLSLTVVDPLSVSVGLLTVVPSGGNSPYTYTILSSNPVDASVSLQSVSGGLSAILSDVSAISGRSGSSVSLELEVSDTGRLNVSLLTVALRVIDRVLLSDRTVTISRGDTSGALLTLLASGGLGVGSYSYSLESAAPELAGNLSLEGNVLSLASVLDIEGVTLTSEVSSSDGFSGATANFEIVVLPSFVLTTDTTTVSVNGGTLSVGLTVVNTLGSSEALSTVSLSGGLAPYSYSVLSVLPSGLTASLSLSALGVLLNNGLVNSGTVGLETIVLEGGDALGNNLRKEFALRIIDEVSLDGLSVAVALGQSTGVVATLSASGGLGTYSYSVIGVLDNRLATLSVSGELLLSVASTLSSAEILTLTIEARDGFTSSRGVVELTVLESFVLGDGSNVLGDLLNLTVVDPLSVSVGLLTVVPSGGNSPYTYTILSSNPVDALVSLQSVSGGLSAILSDVSAISGRSGSSVSLELEVSDTGRLNVSLLTVELRVIDRVLLSDTTVTISRGDTSGALLTLEASGGLGDGTYSYSLESAAPELAGNLSLEGNVLSLASVLDIEGVTLTASVSSSDGFSGATSSFEIVVLPSFVLTTDTTTVSVNGGTLSVGLTVVNTLGSSEALSTVSLSGGLAPYSYSVLSVLPSGLTGSLSLSALGVLLNNGLVNSGTVGLETIVLEGGDALGNNLRKEFALRIIDEVNLDGLSGAVALGQSTGVVATLSASGGLGSYSYSVVGVLDNRLATLSVSGELLLSVASALSSAEVLTLTIEASDGFTSSRGVVELTVLDGFVLGDGSNVLGDLLNLTVVDPLSVSVGLLTVVPSGGNSPYTYTILSSNPVDASVSLQSVSGGLSAILSDVSAISGRSGSSVSLELEVSDTGRLNVSLLTVELRVIDRVLLSDTTVTISRGDTSGSLLTLLASGGLGVGTYSYSLESAAPELAGNLSLEGNVLSLASVLDIEGVTLTSEVSSSDGFSGATSSFEIVVLPSFVLTTDTTTVSVNGGTLSVGLTVVNTLGSSEALSTVLLSGGLAPYSYSVLSVLPSGLTGSLSLSALGVLLNNGLVNSGTVGLETIVLDVGDALGNNLRKELALRIIDEVNLDGLSVAVALGQSTGVVATLSASGGLGSYSYSVVGVLDSRLATLSVSGELLLSVASALSSAEVLTLTIEARDGFTSSRGVVELTVLESFVLGDGSNVLGDLLNLTVVDPLSVSVGLLTVVPSGGNSPYVYTILSSNPVDASVSLQSVSGGLSAILSDVSAISGRSGGSVSLELEVSDTGRLNVSLLTVELRVIDRVLLSDTTVTISRGDTSGSLLTLLASGGLGGGTYSYSLESAAPELAGNLSLEGNVLSLASVLDIEGVTLTASVSSSDGFSGATSSFEIVVLPSFVLTTDTTTVSVNGGTLSVGLTVVNTLGSSEALSTVLLSGGLAPYSYSVLSVLPSGLTGSLSLSALGVLLNNGLVNSGTVGLETIVLEGGDALGNNLRKELALRIIDELNLDGLSVAIALGQSTGVVATLSASGGLGSYSYSVVGGLDNRLATLSVSGELLLSVASALSSAEVLTLTIEARDGFTSSRGVVELTVLESFVLGDGSNVLGDLLNLTVVDPLSVSVALLTVVPSGGSSPYAYTILSSNPVDASVSLQSASGGLSAILSDVSAISGRSGSRVSLELEVSDTGRLNVSLLTVALRVIDRVLLSDTTVTISRGDTSGSLLTLLASGGLGVGTYSYSLESAAPELVGNLSLEGSVLSLASVLDIEGVTLTSEVSSSDGFSGATSSFEIVVLPSFVLTTDTTTVSVNGGTLSVGLTVVNTLGSSEALSTVSLSGGLAPYSYSVLSVLPSGLTGSLSLSALGVLLNNGLVNSGTVGLETIVLEGGDALGNNLRKEFALRIIDEVSLPGTTLTLGRNAIGGILTLSASGGLGSYSYNLLSNRLSTTLVLEPLILETTLSNDDGEATLTLTETVGVLSLTSTVSIGSGLVLSVSADDGFTNVTIEIPVYSSLILVDESDRPLGEGLILLTAVHPLSPSSLTLYSLSLSGGVSPYGYDLLTAYVLSNTVPDPTSLVLSLSVSDRGELIDEGAVESLFSLSLGLGTIVLSVSDSRGVGLEQSVLLEVLSEVSLSSPLTFTVLQSVSEGVVGTLLAEGGSGDYVYSVVGELTSVLSVVSGEGVDGSRVGFVSLTSSLSDLGEFGLTVEVNDGYRVSRGTVFVEVRPSLEFSPSLLSYTISADDLGEVYTVLSSTGAPPYVYSLVSIGSLVLADGLSSEVLQSFSELTLGLSVYDGGIVSLSASLGEAALLAVGSSYTLSLEIAVRDGFTSEVSISLLLEIREGIRFSPLLQTVSVGLNMTGLIAQVQAFVLNSQGSDLSYGLVSVVDLNEAGTSVLSVSSHTVSTELGEIYLLSAFTELGSLTALIEATVGRSNSTLTLLVLGVELLPLSVSFVSLVHEAPLNIETRVGRIVASGGIAPYRYSFGEGVRVDTTNGDVFVRASTVGLLTLSVGILDGSFISPSSAEVGSTVQIFASGSSPLYLIGGENATGSQSLAYRSLDGGRSWLDLSPLGLESFGEFRFGDATVHNDRLFLAGGLGNDYIWGSTNGIQWQRLGDISSISEYGHELVSFGGHLWLIGGVGEGRADSSNEIWRSADEGSTWEPFGVMPSGVSFHEVFSFRGTLFAIGGTGDALGTLSTSYPDARGLENWSSSDLQTWTQRFSPFLISHHAAVVFGNEVWIFGGRGTNGRHSFSRITTNPTNSWNLHSFSLDDATDNLGAAVVDGTLVVVDGNGGDGDVWSTTDGRWTSWIKVAPERFVVEGTPLHNYALLGQNSDFVLPSNTLSLSQPSNTVTVHIDLLSVNVVTLSASGGLIGDYVYSIDTSSVSNLSLRTLSLGDRAVVVLDAVIQIDDFLRLPTFDVTIVVSSQGSLYESATVIFPVTLERDPLSTLSLSQPRNTVTARIDLLSVNVVALNASGGLIGDYVYSIDAPSVSNLGLRTLSVGDRVAVILENFIQADDFLTLSAFDVTVVVSSQGSLYESTTVVFPVILERIPLSLSINIKFSEFETGATPNFGYYGAIGGFGDYQYNINSAINISLIEGRLSLAEPFFVRTTLTAAIEVTDGEGETYTASFTISSRVETDETDVVNDRLYALGVKRSDGRSEILISDDNGATFDRYDTNFAFNRLIIGNQDRVTPLRIFRGSLFFANSDDNGFVVIYASADGRQWFEQARIGRSSRNGRIIHYAFFEYNNQLWLMGGSYSASGAGEPDVWRSDDGANWTQVSDRQDAGDFKNIQASSFTGFNGTLYSSGHQNSSSGFSSAGESFFRSSVSYSTDAENGFQAWSQINSDVFSIALPELPDSIDEIITLSENLGQVIGVVGSNLISFGGYRLDILSSSSVLFADFVRFYDDRIFTSTNGSSWVEKEILLPPINQFTSAFFGITISNGNDSLSALGSPNYRYRLAQTDTRLYALDILRGEILDFSEEGGALSLVVREASVEGDATALISGINSQDRPFNRRYSELYIAAGALAYTPPYEIFVEDVGQPKTEFTLATEQQTISAVTLFVFAVGNSQLVDGLKGISIIYDNTAGNQIQPSREQISFGQSVVINIEAQEAGLLTATVRIYLLSDPDFVHVDYVLTLNFLAPLGAQFKNYFDAIHVDDFAAFSAVGPIAETNYYSYHDAISALDLHEITADANEVVYFPLQTISSNFINEVAEETIVVQGTDTAENIIITDFAKTIRFSNDSILLEN